jgi:hypothetical protein
MKKTAKYLLCVLILLSNKSVYTQNIKIYVTPPMPIPKTIIIKKILPYLNIPDAYLSNTIFISASPGEYEPASFTIKALANGIPDLKIETSPLIGTYGNIPDSNINIKAVKCWYQASARDIYNNGHVLTPELLLNNDNLIIIENNNNYLRLSTDRKAI